MSTAKNISIDDMYDDPNEMRDAGCRFGYTFDLEANSDALTIHIKNDPDKSIKDLIESDVSLWEMENLFDIVEHGNTFEFRGETNLGSYRVHQMDDWPNMCQSMQYVFSNAEQTWYYKTMAESSDWIKIERPMPQLSNPDNFDLI